MKKSTLWSLGGVAAAVLVIGGLRLLPSRPATPAPATPTATTALELAPSDVYTARSETLTVGLPVSGTLKATQTALVKARVAGELMDLSVREGDTVQAGQVLARIDPTEYLARWRQAQQQADSAKAQLDIAQKQFDNNEALVKQGFISQTALQTSQMGLNGARASHQSALAAADVARKALDDATLKAPIAGQVSQRLAQPGERVAVDARIVEIVNLGQFELEVALPAPDAGQARVGMQAQLRIEGLDETVSARVLRINPSTQAGSRSVLVYLGLPGRAGLRQGLFAQGTLGTQTVQTVAVPLSSVRTDKPEPYVQVVDAGVVRHVNVQVGARAEGEGAAQGQQRVAVQGLAEGSQVLAGSVGAVRVGAQARVAAGPASAPAAR
jgi:RND family efflux transporter MFP subunit